MFCPKCGTRVADDDYACYMCGSRLNNNVRSALDILIEKDKERLREGKNLYEWEKADSVSAGNKAVPSAYTVSGQAASDDPIEATVREMFEQRDKAVGRDTAGTFSEGSPDGSGQTESKEYADERIPAASYRPDTYTETYTADTGDSGKKGKLPLAVGIILILIAAGFGAWYILVERPSDKIDEAIETEDIVTVTELYEKLPTEEKKEEVKVSMIERARKLCDDYIREEITYDEVMTEYDALAGNVLEDSAEFEELSARIERINDSRRAFDRAEKSFMHGKYSEAIDGYKEVIEEDERYYSRARENILKCNAAVADQLVGMWAYEYDAHKEVEEFIKAKGFTVDLSKMKIPIVFRFDIKEDETINVSVDYDALDEYVDKILDLAVDAVNNGLGVEGLTDSEVSNWIKYMYGASGIKDSIKKQLNFREALDTLLKNAGMDKPVPYRVEDGRLYIGETGMDAVIEEDVLTLTSEDGSSLVMGNYEMTFPVKMKRRAVDDTESPETPGKKTENISGKDTGSKAQVKTDNTEKDKRKQDQTDGKTVENSQKESGSVNTEKKDTVQTTEKSTGSGTGKTTEKSTGSDTGKITEKSTGSSAEKTTEKSTGSGMGNSTVKTTDETDKEKDSKQ